MKTIHAIYEDGVFRPTEPVELPNGTEVEITPSNGTVLTVDAGTERRSDTTSINRERGVDQFPCGAALQSSRTCS
jgi:predicted DNA-binding antitoxin AbrB/MazE fold protein